MLFTIPADLRAAYAAKIADDMTKLAHNLLHAFGGYIGEPIDHRLVAPPVLKVTWARTAQRRIERVELRTDILERMIDEQIATAVGLLEDRVNRQLAADDVLIVVDLFLNPEKLIEGTVAGVNAKGEHFEIKVKLIENYRYGENSANGVLTVYAQFRGTRTGAKLTKPQTTLAEAAKAARKAEREAAKQAREAARFEKFKGAPRRLAQQIRRYADLFNKTGERLDADLAHADKIEAMSDELIAYAFNELGCRTAGDLENAIERKRLAV